MDIVHINEKLEKEQVISLEHLIKSYFRAKKIGNIAKVHSFQKPVIFSFKERVEEEQKLAIARIIQSKGFEVSWDNIPNEKVA